MPKNKRVKQPALTATKPKGMEHKEQLVENIRAVRKDFADSRLFMGNNKVMAVALGRTKEDSYKDNLYKVARRLTGSCGLLFTNRTKKEVKEYFSEFEVSDFARSGTPSTLDWTVPKGPLHQFGHEMMDQLTKLGLPIKLDRGTLLCLADTIVAKEGESLTPQATQLMKLWDIKSIQFKIFLTSHWTDGTARAIAPPKAS